VVKQLAGHSDIKTMQQFYLSVQPDDLNKANPADPKLTHLGKKRVFSGRKVFRAKIKTLDWQEFMSLLKHAR
jgi:hypothetical protein